MHLDNIFVEGVVVTNHPSTSVNAVTLAISPMLVAITPIQGRSGHLPRMPSTIAEIAVSATIVQVVACPSFLFPSSITSTVFRLIGYIPASNEVVSVRNKVI